MLNVVLYQPEIPPNTGNIIRLCANTGAQLHLIEPLGFDLDDKQLRRAGLDYHEWTNVRTWVDFNAYTEAVAPRRIFTLSTHNTLSYTDAQYAADDTLLFGPETRGLPAALRHAVPENQRLKVPMRPDSRSLNLSNSVAVVVYEAWRQLDFRGAN